MKVGVLSLLVGIAIGWLLLPTPLGVCGWYQSGTAAAWVQALGSIAAILAAVAVAYWQNYTRRKEERAEMRKRVRVYRQTVNAAVQQAMQDATDSAAAFRRFRLTDALSDTELNELAHEAAFTFAIDKSNLHELNDAASDLIVRLGAKSDQYQRNWTDLWHGEMHSRLKAFRQTRDFCIVLLEDIASLASEASGKLSLEAGKTTTPLR